MLHSFQSTRGMVTSPHHLASQSGLAILKKGGTALEAVTAMAATLCAVYPHMTGMGGDAFWLVSYPDGRTEVLEACGAAALHASAHDYTQAGHKSVPWRGGWAANTMAGAVSGWQAALQRSATLQPGLPLEAVLEDAIWYARNGYALTRSEASLLAEKQAELLGNADFAAAYAPHGVLPCAGDIRKNPALAETLQSLVRHGLDSFYAGEVGRKLVADLSRAGSPLRAEDFAHHTVATPAALHVRAGGATVYNTPPPTQGVASLAILKLFEQLNVQEVDGFAYVHALVEATKHAFLFRNAHVGDPRWMTEDAQAFLDDDVRFHAMAAQIDPHRAMPWPAPSQMGDTTWMGAVDSAGVAVSMIQSLYFEFGSGVFLPQTGVLWQNRGASFQLEEGAWNAFVPGRKPFHTLNPALARFDDGRVMVYGTMGGEGQPQTQAAVFTRYALFGVPVQQAVTAPRWLLGRTWGSNSHSLKLESRFDAGVMARLEQAGHEVERVAPFTSMMGHAGAVVRHANGLFEGAADPRSDGCVAAF
ncbi:gamma-glutamyltranspeptidase [Acetobacter syzygii]|uniref:gamma-glutamyltransferase family protein n=1 Tax=Acetobacter syzygii TaxID=146476 RepID=UPI0005E1D5CF|nr:gamma-glutamyltransferase family protein [Acetobacter syzygii]GAN70961.1 gamma-glutamyltranspeptidase [Acetobacter syzygii]GBR66080.1 gamma-glutamyltranspeptidase [Acetobacter syzygii NRIC 0483]GEL56775.1 gamma-glutamyltranspeptidase [Acetobacter syzygii]